MDAGALRDETPLIALGLRVAVFIVGVALVATIVAEPLGVLEAPALARLHTLVAPGQSLWAGLVDCFAAAQPALNLAVSAVLSSLGTGDELALRAADVVALVGLIAAVLMRARSDNPRRLIFAGLLVASPLFWAAPVVVTGWGGNTAALFLLYRLATRDTPSAIQRGIAALLIAALVVNGAGLAVIAVLLGVMLHSGFSSARWQVLGQARNALFLFLALVGLQLTDRLGVPNVSRLIDNLQAIVDALAVGTLMAWPALVSAILAAIVLLAAVAMRWSRSGAGILLIGLVSALLVAASPMSAMTWLAPTGVLPLWLIADAVGTARSPWLAYVMALSLLCWAVALVGADVAALLTPDVTVGFIAAGAALASLALAVAFFITRRHRLGGAALALVVSLGVLTLCQDTNRMFDTRNARASVVSVLDNAKARPVAVLLPMSSVYWSGILDRPVYSAADPAALCRWREAREDRPTPLVILAPARISERLDLHLLQQTPGSPATSVVMAELKGCRQP